MHIYNYTTRAIMFYGHLLLFRVTGDRRGGRSPLKIREVGFVESPLGPLDKLHVSFCRAAHEQPGLDVVRQEILSTESGRYNVNIKHLAHEQPSLDVSSDRRPRQTKSGRYDFNINH